MAPGGLIEEAVGTANQAVACVVRAISDMSLRVAPQKTEALFIHDGTHGVPPRAHVAVNDVPVPVGKTLKYLGLTLDGSWNFTEHFDRLVNKMDGVVGALCRLLPNLGRPDGRVRRLYMGIVNSITLYGVPMWADVAMASKLICGKFRRVQRRMAIRCIRGYRTVSHAAAITLHMMESSTQVITDHGCLQKYLRRIGRARTAQCFHCQDDEDTAQYTLEPCAAFLKNKIREDLSLPSVMKKMLESEEGWNSVISFYNKVMSLKEVAKRE
ncbi:uncharacterized protein LOC114934885 [Nylanderia fulva]|uniref:uncharacterized protein LOC114934885 n=1 Tax=Nylanderia fulva TaxID=613905 RepID=UPI0010FB20EF|nr:uncharacterized protein LOC114934885 [Nylanderia fulva]